MKQGGISSLVTGLFSKSTSSQKYVVVDEAKGGADGEQLHPAPSGVSKVFPRTLTPSVVVPTGLMASDSVMRSLQSQVRN